MADVSNTNNSFGGFTSTTGKEGYGYYNNAADWLGRFWNDISGTSAQNQFNASQSAIEREFNASEAQKNRDWQEYMSNTAYQRQIADMEAAGINPYSISGSGASTPGGSVASATSARSSSSNRSLFSGVLGVLKATIGSQIIANAKKEVASGTSAARAVQSAEHDLRMINSKEGSYKKEYDYLRAKSDFYKNRDKESSFVSSAQSKKSLVGRLKASGEVYDDYESFLDSL